MTASSRTFRGILGEVLKEYRLEKGMTLRDISEKSSVALGYVSELERGHKEASSEILDNLAYGLDVPLYQIIIEVGYRLADWDTPQRILDNELDKELSGV
jgi:transcriptional regulator with XRE-family HTH domain